MLSRTIEVSEKLFELIQQHAEPLVDTANSVLMRWAEQLGKLRGPERWPPEKEPFETTFSELRRELSSLPVQRIETDVPRAQGFPTPAFRLPIAVAILILGGVQTNLRPTAAVSWVCSSMSY